MGDAPRTNEPNGDESMRGPHLVSAPDRLLVLDDKGIYTLPPVPTSLKADLAKALAAFLNQQWSK